MVKIMNRKMIASELLKIAKELLASLVSDCCGARTFGNRSDPICSECGEHCDAVDEDDD